jgi:hypothetical protein
MQYVEAYGLVSEESFPYIARNSECSFDGSNMQVEARIRGYEKLPNNDYDSIMYHLNNNGPLAINVSADHGFVTYQEGVYNGCSTD